MRDFIATLASNVWPHLWNAIAWLSAWLIRAVVWVICGAIWIVFVVSTMNAYEKLLSDWGLRAHRGEVATSLDAIGLILIIAVVVAFLRVPKLVREHARLSRSDVLIRTHDTGDLRMSFTAMNTHRFITVGDGEIKSRGDEAFSTGEANLKERVKDPDAADVHHEYDNN